MIQNIHVSIRMYIKYIIEFSVLKNILEDYK